MKISFKKIISLILALTVIMGALFIHCFSVSAMETISGSYDYLCNYIDKNSQNVLDVFNGLYVTKTTKIDSAYNSVYAVIMKSPEDDSILFFTAYLNILSETATGCAMRVTKAGTSYSVYIADERSTESYTGEASISPATYTNTANYTIKKDDTIVKNAEKSSLFNKLFNDSLTIWEGLLKDKARISLANFGFSKLGYTPIDINATLDGLVWMDSRFYYYKNGKVDTTFKGLSKYESKWYYVSNGTVDYEYVGVADNNYGTWYVQNGTIDFTANGVVASGWTYYYVKNGKVDTSFTGLCKYNGTWWYFSKGKLDINYVGMAKNDYGWWYVKKGNIDFTYTGMAKNEYGWWYITNGKLDTKYTGMAKNDYGWWYMKNGKLDTTFTGLAKNDYGWWYLSKGTIDYKYVGLAKNQYGWWYVKNGRIDTSYNGRASNQYGTWTVKNGKVVS